MSSKQGETKTILSRLIGTWKGQGRGFYPTINSFEFKDQMQFELIGNRPLIYFEQKTWSIIELEPMHMESGFILINEDGSILLNSAQEGGRTEILYGSALCKPNGIQLLMTSKSFGNDERLVRTKREFLLTGTDLQYKMYMQTLTSDFQQHLDSFLTRVS